MEHKITVCVRIGKRGEGGKNPCSCTLKGVEREKKRERECIYIYIYIIFVGTETRYRLDGKGIESR